jgi:hypothetical protein
MPRASGGWTSGWWYGKNGTRSPADDSGPRLDLVRRQIASGSALASVGELDRRRRRATRLRLDRGRSGRPRRRLVGTNAAGRRSSARTTDHYRVYWKLALNTRYKFGR